MHKLLYAHHANTPLLDWLLRKPWAGILLMILYGIRLRFYHDLWKAISVDAVPRNILPRVTHILRLTKWAPNKFRSLQYIPRNMHTVFALLCFVVVIHWLIFPYPSGLLHWHCGNLTITPVPAKQPWWIWINTSCEFIMNDCITTTKQSTTKPCAYFLGYTVFGFAMFWWRSLHPCSEGNPDDYG